MMRLTGTIIAVTVFCLLVASCGTDPSLPQEKPAEGTPAAPVESLAVSRAGGDHAATTRHEVPVLERPHATPLEGPLVALFEPTEAGTSRRIAVPVRDVGRAVDLSARFDLAGTECSFTRFEPAMRIMDRLVPAEGGGGFAALKLVVEARGQKTEKWLIPGSPLLGRAYFRDAILECRAHVSAAEWPDVVSFLTKLYEPTPKILVELKRTGTRTWFPAEAGKRFESEDQAFTVEVLRVVNCFAMTGKEKTVEDQSRLPLNPAAEVRIQRAGETRTTWLFSRLPEFAPQADDEVARLRFVWAVTNHPHPRAEVVLFDAAEGPYQVVVAGQEGMRNYQLHPSKSLELPGITLSVVERMAAARLAQDPMADAQGDPSVRVRVPSESGSTEYWVSGDVPRPIRVGSSLYSVHLASPQAAPHGTRRGPSPHTPQPSRSRMPPGHPPLPSGHPPLRTPPKKSVPSHPLPESFRK